MPDAGKECPEASALLWPAMWPALRYRGPNHALLMQTAILRCGTGDAGEMSDQDTRKVPQ
jgi:hypothetical protein